MVKNAGRALELSLMNIRKFVLGKERVVPYGELHPQLKEKVDSILQDRTGYRGFRTNFTINAGAIGGSTALAGVPRTPGEAAVSGAAALGAYLFAYKLGSRAVRKDTRALGGAIQELKGRPGQFRWAPGVFLGSNGRHDLADISREHSHGFVNANGDLVFRDSPYSRALVAAQGIPVVRELVPGRYRFRV